MTTSLTANAIDGQASPSRSQAQQWLVPFEPPRWLRGGHAQTLAGNYWRRKPFHVSFERGRRRGRPKRRQPDPVSLPLAAGAGAMPAG
jgi:hypothetical protein